MSITLEVVGPHRGKTFKFRHYQFTNGRIVVDGPSQEAILGTCRYLEVTQQAYPVGSSELQEAIGRIHGNDKVHPSAGGGKAEKVPGGAAPAPQSPSPEVKTDGGRDDGAQAGAAGVVPEGSGSERPKEVNQPPSQGKKEVKNVK